MTGNQELSDLCQAMGVVTGARFNLDDLRYEKVIIMTDADVDGAHIAALLMTFFFTQMKPLIDAGHLFLAAPPLFRLVQGARSVYVRDEAAKDRLLAKGLGGRGKIEVSRFKGLGEMMPAQLKETTMNPATRTLIRVTVADDLGETGDLVERLMGRDRRCASGHRGERPVRERIWTCDQGFGGLAPWWSHGVARVQTVATHLFQNDFLRSAYQTSPYRLRRVERVFRAFAMARLRRSDPS